MVFVNSHMNFVPTRKPAAAETARLKWIDTAKGVGIIFVVFGHAWRGAFDAGILRDGALFRQIDAMIYSWHMPLFFFLSGLLCLDAFRNVQAAKFIWARVLRLLWPMALWTWLFFGIKLALGNAVNHPVAMSDFPAVPLPPYEHLWFLWALFVQQVLVFAVLTTLFQKSDTGLIRVTAGVTALALTLSIPFFYFPSQMFGAALEHLPYFLAGLACGGIAHLRPSGWTAAGAAVLIAVGIADLGSHWATLVQSLGLTMLICILISWFDSSEEEPGGAVRVLRYLGLCSLPIFLAHTIFSAAFRIGMLKVGVDNLTVHLVVATIVGLLGPIVLARISAALGMRRVLGF